VSAALSRRVVLLWLAMTLLDIVAGAGSARADSDGGGGGSGSGGSGSGSGSGGVGGDGGGDNSGKGGGDDGGGDDGGDDNGGGHGRGRGRDHKRAQDAVKSGKSRPLPEILSSVSSQYPGKVIDVRLNRRSNGLVYDVKVITPAGQLIRVRVDAASGAIVDVKGI